MDSVNTYRQDTPERRRRLELQMLNEEIRQNRAKARTHGLDTEIGKAYFTVAELLEATR